MQSTSSLRSQYVIKTWIQGRLHQSRVSNNFEVNLGKYRDRSLLRLTWRNKDRDRFADNCCDETQSKQVGETSRRRMRGRGEGFGKGAIPSPENVWLGMAHFDWFYGVKIETFSLANNHTYPYTILFEDFLQLCYCKTVLLSMNNREGWPADSTSTSYSDLFVTRRYGKCFWKWSLTNICVCSRSVMSDMNLMTNYKRL